MKKKRFTEEQIVGMLRQAEQSGQAAYESAQVSPYFLFFLFFELSSINVFDIHNYRRRVDPNVSALFDSNVRCFAAKLIIVQE